MSKRDRAELKAQMARALAEGKLEVYQQLLEQLVRGAL